MKKKNLNIALQLEGTEDESGNIRLDDFLSEIAALRATLSAIDRDVNGKHTVYFSVVDLSHSSPAKIVIEPKVKPSLVGKTGRGQYRQSPTRIHHALFDTLTKIKDNKLTRITAGVEVIDAVSEMVDGLGSRFSKGWIANSDRVIQLNTEFREHLNELIRPQYQSFGSVTGELLALSLARGSRFYVYPAAGPTSVACSFSSDQLRERERTSGRLSEFTAQNNLERLRGCLTASQMWIGLSLFPRPQRSGNSRAHKALKTIFRRMNSFVVLGTNGNEPTKGRSCVLDVVCLRCAPRKGAQLSTGDG